MRRANARREDEEAGWTGGARDGKEGKGAGSSEHGQRRR